MNNIDLVPVPHIKQAGLLQGALRYLRRPFIGAERAAVGAEKQLGQMSAKAEQSIANQVTRSGMSRDTSNEILRKFHAGEGYSPATVLGLGGLGYGGYEGYNEALRTGDMSKVLKGALIGGGAGFLGGKALGAALPLALRGNKSHQELYEAYQKAAPNSVTSKIRPKEELMTTFKQFEQGTGKFKDTGKFVGTRAERIEAQRLRDLEASFSSFGRDQKALFNLEKQINAAKAGEAGAGNLEQLLAQRADILATHGRGLLGQKTNYYARRAADSLLEKGQFNTLGERLRFGRLGGAYIGGRGLEVVAARARQGGLLGKGGLIRGGLAFDPRIRMNLDMARFAAGQGQYGQALRYGTNAAIGSGVQAGKVGLMGVMPAYGVYSAIAEDDPEQSTLRRVGGAVGRGFGMTAMLPLGAATWGLSMLPGMEAYSASEQLGRGLEYLADASTGAPPVQSVNSTPNQAVNPNIYVGTDGRLYRNSGLNMRPTLPSPQVPNYSA